MPLPIKPEAMLTSMAGICFLEGLVSEIYSLVDFNEERDRKVIMVLLYAPYGDI